MKHRIFYPLKLVLIENKGKFTLYKSETPIPHTGELAQLQAVDFIRENADYIAVYPECGLIIADSLLYSVQGQKITDYPLDGIQICSKQGIYILTFASSTYPSNHLLLWDGLKVLLSVKYQKYIESDFYFAVYADKKWSVYDWEGHLKNGNYPLAGEDISIEGHFLVNGSAGNHDLYSLKYGQLLRQKQIVVLCSKTADFAVCASSSHRLEVFDDGVWHYLDDFTFFNLLDNINMFCIQQGDKYYLYRYPRLRPFLSRKFPQGLDFVSYDEQTQTLIVKSSGKSFVISKRKALGKC